MLRELCLKFNNLGIKDPSTKDGMFVTYKGLANTLKLLPEKNINTILSLASHFAETTKDVDLEKVLEANELSNFKPYVAKIDGAPALILNRYFYIVFEDLKFKLVSVAKYEDSVKYNNWFDLLPLYQVYLEDYKDRNSVLLNYFYAALLDVFTVYAYGKDVFQNYELRETIDMFFEEAMEYVGVNPAGYNFNEFMDLFKESSKYFKDKSNVVTATNSQGLKVEYEVYENSVLIFSAGNWFYCKTPKAHCKAYREQVALQMELDTYNSRSTKLIVILLSTFKCLWAGHSCATEFKAKEN